MPLTPLPPSIHTSLYALFLFFFNDTATTESYTLSPHDALPISHGSQEQEDRRRRRRGPRGRRDSDRGQLEPALGDRKSTRLNTSHMSISNAVFCLKKKKKKNKVIYSKHTAHVIAVTCTMLDVIL